MSSTLGPLWVLSRTRATRHTQAKRRTKKGSNMGVSSALHRTLTPSSEATLFLPKEPLVQRLVPRDLLALSLTGSVPTCPRPVTLKTGPYPRRSVFPSLHTRTCEESTRTRTHVLTQRSRRYCFFLFPRMSAGVENTWNRDSAVCLFFVESTHANLAHSTRTP